MKRVQLIVAMYFDVPDDVIVNPKNLCVSIAADSVHLSSTDKAEEPQVAAIGLDSYETESVQSYPSLESARPNPEIQAAREQGEVYGLMGPFGSCKASQPE